MADYNKPKDPNWLCTFTLRKNPDKDPNKPETKNRPDYVLVDSTNKDGTPNLNKSGNPFKKNFTVHEVWSEASGYKQPDNTLKITLKKTSSFGTAPQPQNTTGFKEVVVDEF